MTKCAIVTGASRGIGAAAVAALAEAGFSVLAMARTRADLDAVTAAAGDRALAYVGDVRTYSDMENAVAAAEKAFGPLGLLVNNAGVIDPIARLEDSDPAGWARAVEINLMGVYHGLRAAAPGMKARGRGVVVNISSGAAVSALEGWSHYCASKAAALSLTRCADKELFEHGVRVVGLSPGTVATDMQVEIKASGINPVSQLDPNVHIPPEWVGRAIAWLASDDAAEFHGVDVSLRDRAIRERVGVGGE